MKHTTYQCDCCRKFFSKDTIAKVKMPIIVHILQKGDAMRVYKMDFCVNCANRFTELYYEIANENGASGIQGVRLG